MMIGTGVPPLVVYPTLPGTHARPTEGQSLVAAVGAGDSGTGTSASASASNVANSSADAGGNRPEAESEAKPGAGEDPRRARGPGAAEADLSEAERRELLDLKVRDRAVRAHEQAHVAAGGSLVTRGATFDYQTGPDGQRYAVGGEVRIDVSAGRNPQETMTKAQRIISAALAPADPSPQDRRVASDAQRMAAEARVEAAREAEAERAQAAEDATADDSEAPASASSESSGNVVSSNATLSFENQAAISEYQDLSQSAYEQSVSGIGATVDFYV